MVHIVYINMQPKDGHTVSSAVKLLLVQLRCMFPVTLLFVIRNLLVPEIVCGHGGHRSYPTPSSLYRPLSCQRQAGQGAEGWWGAGGCGLRMDNKYSV